MLINWLANKVATRLGLTPDAISSHVNSVMDARRDADAKHVRELIAEMDDTMEKFSRVVAREGMRRARAMKEAMDPPAPAAAAAPAADELAGRRLSKQELRMKAQREGVL